MVGAIDFVLLGILAVVTWCVAGEGAFSAAITCLSVLVAGLVSMNYFEPLANHLPTTGFWYRWADTVCLIGLFTVTVTVLRLGSEQLAPRFIRMPVLPYGLLRWGAALLTGYVTMAFLLTALHTTPLPREFLGFRPERNNFFDVVAPDRQWLGFTQYVSENFLRKGRTGHIFDGPRIRLGDPNNPYPNEIWPSFPIRYATRRELLSGSGQATPTSSSGPPRRRRVRIRPGTGF